MKKNNSTKNKLMWSLLFLIIAAASIWAVSAQSKNFSLSNFIDFISSASLPYLISAVLSMLCFIFFEGAAIVCICRAFGYKPTLLNGFSYSAADIYFSSITPSASGGQPASGIFMTKDGIPPIFVTLALIVNLVMYVSAIIVIALLCIIFTPSLFLNFGIVSQILIIFGVVAQAVLLIALISLLKNEKIIKCFCNLAVKFLRFIHLKNKADILQKKLDVTVEKYAEYSQLLAGKKSMLFKVFLCNFVQRAAQIAVTPLVYLATGGATKNALLLWFMQGYVVIGSNCIPIPGAMGVTDFLMLDGFGTIMPPASATNLELLSRSISFYFCIIICGITIALKYFIQVKKNRKVNY